MSGDRSRNHLARVPVIERNRKMVGPTRKTYERTSLTFATASVALLVIAAQS